MGGGGGLLFRISGKMGRGWGGWGGCGGLWGGDRQRNRHVNAQALSKLPSSNLPLRLGWPATEWESGTKPKMAEKRPAKWPAAIFLGGSKMNLPFSFCPKHAEGQKLRSATSGPTSLREYRCIGSFTTATHTFR